jgi:ring-1,2-phenylacetyl-CoA epoxidase subunit PaaE
MLSFHPLQVVSANRIAEDAVCLTLAVPPALRETFRFDAGQYVTVRRTIDGREERRTYSIVTAPGERQLRLGVREQTGGRMSRELASQVKAGDLLEIGTPMGRFRTATDAKRTRRYAAFAAGSGITPVLSIAAHILAIEPASRVTLVYGNRSMARTMFLEEALALKNRYLDRFSLYFVMSREPQQTALLNGRIDAAKVAEFARDIVDVATADEYFVCGPGHMVEEVRSALKTVNPEAPVRIERFSPASAQPAAEPGSTAAAAILSSSAEQTTITIHMDGRQRSFSMAPGDGSVLEAAERAGLDLPFSCRAGICATCRTRIVSGEAVMEHNIALEPWEIEAGFVLCCQARPVTASLELSYDEK